MEVFQLLPKVRWRRRESATSTSSLMGRGAFCWSFLFGFSLRLEWGWLQSGLTWNFLELFWSLDLVRKAKQPHKIPWAQVGFKDTACKAESSWLLRERAEDTVRRNNGQQVDLCAFRPTTALSGILWAEDLLMFENPCHWARLLRKRRAKLKRAVTCAWCHIS